MATIHKALNKASQTGLRLVVVGQGETRGRRPHLVRLRESLISELKVVADGQMYLLLEVALRRFIDELRARPEGLEVIRAVELEAGPEDDILLDQHDAKIVKKRAPVRRTAAKKAKVKGVESDPVSERP